MRRSCLNLQGKVPLGEEKPAVPPRMSSFVAECERRVSEGRECRRGTRSFSITCAVLVLAIAAAAPPSPRFTAPRGCTPAAASTSSPHPPPPQDYASAAAALEALAAAARADPVQCPDLARSHALAAALLAQCTASAAAPEAAPPPPRDVALRIARQTVTLTAIAIAAGLDFSPCRSVAAPAFCLPSNEAAPCEPRELLRASDDNGVLVAHVTAVGELATFSLMLNAASAAYVRALLAEVGDATAGRAAELTAPLLSPLRGWHVTGLPDAGVDAVVRLADVAPQFSFYFAASYHALASERAFKSQLHSRLAFLFEHAPVVERGAAALLLAGGAAGGALAEADATLGALALAAPLPRFRADAGAPCSARILVIDPHWMRGFASHRVTRPLVAALAAAACTTLLFGQMAGTPEEAGEGGAGGVGVGDFADARQGFAQSVGLAVLNETLTGGAAWRLALARRIAAARFDAVWFASVGMTSLDTVLASFPLARVQALGVGHPASTGSGALTHFFSGALPEVIGPLAASVSEPFGSAGDCRGRLAELEAALAGMCEENGGGGGESGGESSGETRYPLLVMCGNGSLASAASMPPAEASAVLAARGGCRLCRRFNLRGPAAAMPAAGAEGGEGECRGVAAHSSPGRHSLAHALLRRLADAQQRYSERLVLAPGIGMGLTDVVTRVALPVRRRIALLDEDGRVRLEAAARAVEALGGATAPLRALASLIGRTASAGRAAGEDGGGGGGGSGGGGEWAAGSSPERPLVIGLSYSNPKWNMRHLRRILSAARSAQLRFSLQWHRCDRLRKAGEPAGAGDDVCARLLCTAPQPALHLRLLAFTPMDGLRAAALHAIAARVIAAELPPSARGSLAFELVFQAGNMDEYLSALGASDLALDAQPFAGGNTMHDLLALAVPVVSLSHDGLFEDGTATPLRWRSALGASVLTKAGLSGLVALDEAEFAAKFARLAANPYLREAWRRRIAAAAPPHEAIQTPLEAACYAAALRALSAGA